MFSRNSRIWFWGFLYFAVMTLAQRTFPETATKITLVPVVEAFCFCVILSFGRPFWTAIAELYLKSPKLSTVAEQKKSGKVLEKYERDIRYFKYILGLCVIMLAPFSLWTPAFLVLFAGIQFSMLAYFVPIIVDK